MLSIFETGDESFRLTDRHDVDVGWIRGSAIGFDGFASEADALAAAVAGSDALLGYLDRLTGAGLRAEKKGGRVRVKSDGEYDWIVQGSAQLARLYRPEDSGSPGGQRQTFGVEFVLPSYVKPGAAISASQVVHKAIGARVAAALPTGAAGGALLGALAERATGADGMAAR